ncbi:MAG: hypothetical protein KC635_04715 [Myxococcales bacterium]|nr:hypothetical protein [Myxococcales bacterium]MCB9736405.1 hypothetical protein [Deltaproteobacteria bacterium]
MKSLSMVMISAASGLLALGGCADEDALPGGGLGGATLHVAALGDCASNENRDRQFPRGADRVVLELTGGAIPSGTPVILSALASDATAAGEVIVPGVPPGQGMTLRVVACAGAEALWAGETGGVDVVANEKTFPTVFLTPVDKVACTGNAESSAGARDMREGRAFAALAADGDAAWVFGGLSGYTASTVTATATATIDRYDRTTGEFEGAGGLQSARAMALAVPQADGKIKVYGGTTRLVIASFGKPALWAAHGDAPSAASEIYDPETEQSQVDVAQPLPALPALAATDAGVVLAVGGVEQGGVGNDPDAVSQNMTRFDGDGAASAELPDSGRIGATVVPLGDRFLVWGGNADGDVANAGLLVSASGALATGVDRLTVNGLASVPIFAAGARLSDGAGGTARVLVAGGGTIQSDGSFLPRDVEAARLQVVVIDATLGTATVTDVDTGAAGLGTAFQRGAARLMPLGGDNFWLYGGYTAFVPKDICGGTGSDCLPAKTVRFAMTGIDTAPTATPVGNALELSVGPLGAGALPLGDGAILVTSGIATITQSSLGKAAALVRFAAFERDLCALAP